MAGKLFIVASTAISFILDPLRLAPAKQMAQLLNAKSGATLAGEPMDHLYIQVLRAAVPKHVGDWFEDYQAVVGTIVVAADVLSTQSLASLLDMDPNGIVGALSHLHSLIAPTRDGDAFHVHHKSFPDFVTDKSRCAIDSRFFIEASARHFHLAQHCLRIMTKMLKQNICQLPRSDWDVELSGLPPGTIKARIPSELAYACAYWVFHLREGLHHLVGRDDVIDQFKVFVEQHLLSWLELLPMAGQLEGPLSNLEHIGSVLRDLLRFISLHPELPRRLPMHIYLSTLPFVPSESKLRRLYAKSTSNATHSIAVVSGLEQHWDPISVTFRESPMAMDLSPCGTMIATRSSRVRLYNAKSGQLLQSLGSEMLVGNTEYASVAFSSDSRYIASTTSFGVQLWDVVSGELVGNCFGVRDQRRLISPPISVSLDKEMVVIDCDPFLISIYSVRTQHHLCNLSGHQGIVTTTAFAPHDHLCSASEDRTVRLWDVTT
ncbi:quinon protein alcohol dehydrogenase-like superfamily, partial [Coprinopsis sp. MPI-PUGE-AT-0042]